MQMVSDETRARIEEIKRVCGSKRYSAGQIAAMVSFPASRNVIIGLFTRHADKLHPVVLGGRVVTRPVNNGKKPRSKIEPKPQTAHEKQVAEARVQLVTTPAATVKPLLLKLVDMTSAQCKWPLDHKGETRYCGNEIAGPGSFCPHHYARAYVASSERKKGSR